MKKKRPSRRSLRHPNWDYRSANAYFITCCTKPRIHHFGQITDGQMHLSELGKIVEEEWLRGPELRPDMNLVLHEFVVMPDHFHAILAIGNNNFNEWPDLDGNAFGPQSKNLASVIRGFKGGVTRRAKELGYSDFSWQARFYDRIISSERAHWNMEQYILDNPKNWNG